MPAGGARAGAGRKPGGNNRLTREAAEKAAATGLMPLDYLLQVMRDASVEDARRIDAAKAAAPYVHARLSQIEATVNATVSHEDALASLR